MLKTDVINALHNARMAHKSWVSYAHLITKGGGAEEFDKKTPLVPTECEFGKWYFQDGADLTKFTAYHDIEKPHERVHEIYSDIYFLIKNKVKKGFFETTKSAERKRDAQVDALLEQMDEQAEKLMLAFDNLEKEVSSLTDAELYNKIK